MQPAGVISPSRHLEHVAAQVALVAAELVRASVGKAAAERTKSSLTDVVTATDFASERLIRDELLARCPGSAIVGEEFEDEVGSNRIGWVVDPIDGTVNFLYDLPVVSVSIAATIEGRVVAGAVADVLRGDMYTASSGHGARLNGVEITAADPGELSQALVGTGFSYDSVIRAHEAEVLNQVLPACRDIRCMGSAALNLCWVASGRLNAFYERDLKTYDYAAAAHIAEEAGARVELPADNDTDLTIGAGAKIFSPLRSLVASFGA